MHHVRDYLIHFDALVGMPFDFVGASDPTGRQLSHDTPDDLNQSADRTELGSKRENAHEKTDDPRHDSERQENEEPQQEVEATVPPTIATGATAREDRRDKEHSHVEDRQDDDKGLMAALRIPVIIIIILGAAVIIIIVLSILRFVHTDKEHLKTCA